MRATISVAIAIAWIAVSAAMAMSDPYNTFAGRWAVTAEGRILMVLTLEPKAGKQELRGSLQRPAHMRLYSNTVSAVSLPVEDEEVIGADAKDNGIRLQFRDAKGQVTEWQLEPNGPNAASLKLAGTPPGIPAPVLHFSRVDSAASIAPSWDAAHSYALDEPGAPETDNAVMTRLFEADQAERKVEIAIDPKELVRADAERRRTATEMLRQGKLHTGLDFLHAAFVFQHGSQSKDFLLAHALALAALAKGRADAGWIAAASLDRYLQSEGKAQIYGTQFHGDSQDPYDRILLPDALRQQLGVPLASEQHAPSLHLFSTSAKNCSNISGETTLWSDPKTRFIIIGEYHGTNEEPALFADLVCSAYASGRPVVAAVEIAEDQQPAMDSFLNSDGAPDAKDAFLRSAHWHSPMKDGRSSNAYFALLERLRLLHQSGKVVGVVAIQPALKRLEHEKVEQSVALDNEANAAMANLIKTAASLRPDALVLVLVGELHARKMPVAMGGQSIIPAASLLPPSETLALRITTGGEAWNCDGAMVCGVHPLAGAQGGRREIRLGPGAPRGFDGVIDLGTTASASLPVAVK